MDRQTAACGQEAEIWRPVTTSSHTSTPPSAARPRLGEDARERGGGVVEQGRLTGHGHSLYSLAVHYTADMLPSSTAPPPPPPPHTHTPPFLRHHLPCLPPSVHHLVTLLSSWVPPPSIVLPCKPVRHCPASCVFTAELSCIVCDHCLAVLYRV